MRVGSISVCKAGKRKHVAGKMGKGKLLYRHWKRQSAHQMTVSTSSTQPHMRIQDMSCVINTHTRPDVAGAVIAVGWEREGQKMNELVSAEWKGEEHRAQKNRFVQCNPELRAYRNGALATPRLKRTRETEIGSTSPPRACSTATQCPTTVHAHRASVLGKTHSQKSSLKIFCWNLTDARVATFLKNNRTQKKKVGF